MSAVVSLVFECGVCATLTPWCRTQTILYSEGFRTGKVLGKKLVSIFRLSKQLLSVQQHYDWGLRALKTVLSVAGNLVKTEKKVLVVSPGCFQEKKLFFVLRASVFLCCFPFSFPLPWITLVPNDCPFFCCVGLHLLLLFCDTGLACIHMLFHRVLFFWICCSLSNLETCHPLAKRNW